MDEENEKAQDAAEINPPDAPLAILPPVAVNTLSVTGGAASAARQKKQMLLISGIVLVLLTAVVALTSVTLSNPKKAIQKAFAATVAAQNKRMERIRAEVPMMRERAGGKAEQTDFAITFRKLRGDLPDEVLMAAKLLEGLNVRGAAARDPASGVAELDAGLALGAARLIGGYFYASPELIAAGSPDFSDVVLTVNPKTFAADAMASPLYGALGMDEEQLMKLQEAIDGGLRALTDERSDSLPEDAQGTADELGLIFTTMITDVRYEKVGKEGKNTLYRVTVPGEDVKRALLTAMEYLYFESSVSGLFRTVYATALPSDVSYEEYIGEMMARLWEDCPALPMELNLTVDKTIQYAMLSIVPSNAVSISAPFDEILLGFSVQDETVSFAAEYSAYLGGIPAVLGLSYNESDRDGTYSQSLSLVADGGEYLNATLSAAMDRGRDDSYYANIDLNAVNGGDWITFGADTNGTVKTSGGKRTYDFPDVSINAKGTRVGSIFGAEERIGGAYVSFAVKADIAPLAVPYAMKKPAKPFFSMDSAALETELGKYEQGVSQLFIQFLQLLFTGSAA